MRTRPFRLPALLSLSLLLAASPALAEEERPTPDDRWAVAGVLENDLFAGTDRHYTNGVLANALSPQGETLGIPKGWWSLLPGHRPGVSQERVGFHLGQSMFTPEDITIAAPQPGDRPWGAWLHGGVSLVSEDRRQLRALTLDIGTVGPAAFGEEAQSFVHDVIGSDEPQGWGNQIPNEPTITLAYDHKWQNVFEWRPEDGLGVDFMPHVSGALGNAFTYAGAGATFRLGQNLPDDFGPLMIRPGSAGSALYRPQGGLSWYLFAGSEARVVARNVFLDGPLFQDGPSVSKKPIVADLVLGASLAYERVRLTYSFVMRSKEFDGQDAIDKFASLSLTLKF